MLVVTYAQGGVELCAAGKTQVVWLPTGAAARPSLGEGCGDGSRRGVAAGGGEGCEGVGEAERAEEGGAGPSDKATPKADGKRMKLEVRVRG